jgi:hypothetical protein
LALLAELPLVELVGLPLVELVGLRLEVLQGALLEALLEEALALPLVLGWGLL